MISLSVIGIPVFLDTNTSPSHLLRQWARLYHYGHLYMPAACMAATGLYAYAALRKRAAGDGRWPRYAAAGATTMSMVPFTWVLMAPTNDALFGLLPLASAGEPVDMGELRALVVSWAWLHLARSLFPLAGAVLGLLGVFGELGL